jgi:hypothetical protein
LNLIFLRNLKQHFLQEKFITKLLVLRQEWNLCICKNSCRRDFALVDFILILLLMQFLKDYLECINQHLIKLYRVIHLLPPVAKWPLRIEKNLWNLQIWFVEKFTFGRYNLFKKKFFFYEQIFIKSCLKKKNMFKFLHQNVANGV